MRAGILKNDHAARVAAGLEIGKSLRRLVDAIAARDELFELQLALEIERQHARKIDPRHARAEIAAGDGLLLEGQRHRADRSRIGWLRDADDDRKAAAADRAIRGRRKLARADAFEGVVGTAAGQLLQRL